MQNDMNHKLATTTKIKLICLSFSSTLKNTTQSKFQKKIIKEIGISRSTDTHQSMTQSPPGKAP
jgi:hypothetical protein